MGWLPAVVGAALLVGYPAMFVHAAARAGRPGARRDRLALVSGFATAVIGLALGRVWVPWDVVPPLAWALPVAATSYGVVVTGWAWRSLPVLASGRPWARYAGAGFTVALAATVVYLTA